LAYCTTLIVYLHCILHLLHSLFPISSMIRRLGGSKWRSTTQIQKSAQFTSYLYLPSYFSEATMLLPSISMTPAAIFWTMLVISATSILADTEIRNFHLPLPPSTRSIHPSTQILDIPLPISPKVLNISISSPELWIRTPLEGYTSWTARVSWPASVRHYRQRG
jgi:hypothetical protein